MFMKILISFAFCTFVIANGGGLLAKICKNESKWFYLDSKGFNSDAFENRNDRNHVPIFIFFNSDLFSVVELEVFSRVDVLSWSHFWV